MCYLCNFINLLIIFSFKFTFSISFNSEKRSTLLALIYSLKAFVITLISHNKVWSKELDKFYSLLCRLIESVFIVILIKVYRVKRKALLDNSEVCSSTHFVQRIQSTIDISAKKSYTFVCRKLIHLRTVPLT